MSTSRIRLRYSRLIICTLLWITASLSCSPPKPNPATLVYQELVNHLSRGSVEGVWSTLSIESKASLRGTLGNHKNTTTVPDTLALELDWAFESPFAGQATPVDAPLQKSGQIVYLQTIYASQQWIIPVVLEEGYWRVHLLGAHRKLP